MLQSPTLSTETPRRQDLKAFVRSAGPLESSGDDSRLWTPSSSRLRQGGRALREVTAQPRHLVSPQLPGPCPSRGVPQPHAWRDTLHGHRHTRTTSHPDTHTSARRAECEDTNALTAWSTAPRPRPTNPGQFFGSPRTGFLDCPRRKAASPTQCSRGLLTLPEMESSPRCLRPRGGRCWNTDAERREVGGREETQTWACHMWLLTCGKHRSASP